MVVQPQAAAVTSPSRSESSDGILCRSLNLTDNWFPGFKKLIVHPILECFHSPSIVALAPPRFGALRLRSVAGLHQETSKITYSFHDTLRQCLKTWWRTAAANRRDQRRAHKPHTRQWHSHSHRRSHMMFITVKFTCYHPNLDARQSRRICTILYISSLTTSSLSVYLPTCVTKIYEQHI